MLALIEVVSGILNFLEMLYTTGCGLLWLTSPTFRQEVRDSGERARETHYVFAAYFTCFILAVIFGLAAYFLFKFFLTARRRARQGPFSRLEPVRHL